VQECENAARDKQTDRHTDGRDQYISPRLRLMQNVTKDNTGTKWQKKQKSKLKWKENLSEQLTLRTADVCLLVC